MRLALAVAAAAVMIPATPAVAAPKGKPACKDRQLRIAYGVNHRRVDRAFGNGTAGRNIRNTRRCRQVARAVRTYRRWLNSPRASASRHDRTPTRHRTSPRNTGGKYAIPAYIVWRESRGNYGIYNRSGSGAYGAYQIMPFHWTRGVCKGLGRDPAGQDACAAILWAEGSHHWAATR